MRKSNYLPQYLIALIFTLAYAAPAAADTTLVYDTADGEFIIKVRPGEIRIDDASDRWQLYRQSEGAIYSVEPQAKQYVKMDQQAASAIRGQMQALREQMEKQLAELGEAQRAQARAIMAQQIPGLDGKQQEISLEPTGDTDQVAGKQCSQIRVLRNDEPKETLCVASAKTLGMSAEEFESVEAMFGLMKTMLAGTGLEHIGLPYLRLNGMPIRYQDPASGQTRVLKRLNHDKLPNLAFEIPPGYSAQATPTGNGG